MIDWGLTSSSVKCLWVSFYWRASTTDILVEATANCVETRDGSRMTSKKRDTWNRDNYNIK